jgi:hypothetical protein
MCHINVGEDRIYVAPNTDQEPAVVNTVTSLQFCT